MIDKKMRQIVKKLILLLVLSTLYGVDGMAGSPSYESAYTSIDADDCRTVIEEEISITQYCKSFANIEVEVLGDDLRQSITLKRNGISYPLEYWRKISTAWSLLGKKIEWRYPKGQADNPIAMIARFNVSEDLDNPDKMTSYLVVSKISRDIICPVGKIRPQAKQNRLAREMAERSDKMRCIE